MSRPTMPHIPDPFPHEERPHRRHVGLDRLPRVTREEIDAARIAREEDARRATEADLRLAARADSPPEQVRTDARAAYRKREHTTAYAFTCPKCRSILAVWVLLAAYTITVFVLIALTIRSAA